MAPRGERPNEFKMARITEGCVIAAITTAFPLHRAHSREIFACDFLTQHTAFFVLPACRARVARVCRAQ